MQGTNLKKLAMSLMVVMETNINDAGIAVAMTLKRTITMITIMLI